METISMGTHENGGQESEAQPVEPKFWYFKESHLIFEKAEMEAYAKITGYEPIPLYLAPPSAKAIETAALMKAAEVCKARGDRALSAQIGSADDLSNIFLRHHAITAYDCQEAILALITPEGKTALEEFSWKLATRIRNGMPASCRPEDEQLRAIVKQVMEGEK